MHEDIHDRCSLPEARSSRDVQALIWKLEAEVSSRSNQRADHTFFISKVYFAE